MLEQAGVEFFNPDKVARQFQSMYPGISQEEAISTAWQQGRRLLERAIDERKDFAFETTLGGNTIAVLLKKPRLVSASKSESGTLAWKAQNCISRAYSPEFRWGGMTFRRAKYGNATSQSRMRLIELMPALAELKVFDNTEEGDPQKGQAPALKLLLHMNSGKIVTAYDLHRIPQWAKPIIQAAIAVSAET